MILEPLAICLMVSMAFAEPIKKYNYECETRTGNFEGDMLLQQRQLDTIRTGRQPVVTEVDRWINNVVPYVLDSEYLTNYHGQQVRQAMTQIELVSSVRFVPKQHDVVDYLVISGEPTGGCWATLGRNRGLNRMNLATGECFSEGTIVHQLLHVLGFGHATNALDRDFHVDIDWDQVRPEHYEGLAIYPGVAMPDFGVPFDEDSIMNFGTTHFGRNGSVTIRVKHGAQSFGQRDKMSVKDIMKLNKMYPCGWC
ncbi:hypothetical protein quinque_006677 [Culex quinquefasciatus]